MIGTERSEPMVSPPVEGLREKTQHATKWSLLTEFLARIVTPVTQMVLARLLAPEAFGVVAVVVMITSFAEMLSDAGFQKYLIQRSFQDKQDLDRFANVAFWSSLTVATATLALIVVFRDALATLAGNESLGFALAVASCSIPLSVVTSTQLALFRRAFEYKRVLPIRVGSALISLAVSVPLALLGFGYWALIGGIIAAAATSALALTMVSTWKPRGFFSFKILREMFAFSSWSLLEAISIWLTTWAGAFIVNRLLSTYELGLYQQPMTIINAVFALVTSATTPILFSALSRLQENSVEFAKFFLRFQFSVSMFVLPLGVGSFFFRDFLTGVVLGTQWINGSLMFGVWGLSTIFMIIFSHYCSEVYRSLGRPKISLLAQMLYLIIMAPALYLAALDSFLTLVIVSGAIRSVAIVINQTFTFFIAGIGFIAVVRNLYGPILCVGIMAVVAAWLSSAIPATSAWSIGAIAACALVYALASLAFPSSRRFILTPIRSVLNRSRV